jgi:hypothetical protein
LTDKDILFMTSITPRLNRLFAPVEQALQLVESA